MSTIKSQDENLTLNAHGSGNDIKFQSNGVEKASISDAGLFTSTTIDATALTGTIPNFTSTGIDDNADATAITIDSAENVGIGVTPESGWHSQMDVLQLGVTSALIGADHTGGNIRTRLYHNSYNTSDGSQKYITANEASALFMTESGTMEFQVASSGSADAAITWTTGFEVLNDGKARAKNGLLFGTDTATANALDDYEEGTWTPTASGSTGGLGYYTKIGRLVHCVGTIGFAVQTNSGHATVESLPFTSTNESVGFTGTLRYTNYSAGQLMLTGNKNTNTFSLYDLVYGTGISTTSWTEASGKTIQFDITYSTT